MIPRPANTVNHTLYFVVGTEDTGEHQKFPDKSIGQVARQYWPMQ